MKKRIRGKLFIKTSNYAFLTEDINQRAVIEQTVRTFRLTKQKNKFVLYELRRKKNPRRVKTFKVKKNEKLDDRIKLIQKEEFKINQKHIQSIGIGGTKIIQTNYNARINLQPQMLGLVKIKDTKRMILDFFIGYSKKSPVTPNSNNISKMENEVMDMAIAKFFNVYGFTNYQDLEVKIIEKKFVYYKNTYEERRAKKMSEQYPA